MQADLIVKGKIFTAQEDASCVECFAVKDGKIVYVGDWKEGKEWRGADTCVQEYKEGLVVPGFTEGHAHVSSTVELLVGPLVNQTTISGCLQAIYQFDREHPGDTTIYGGGFDPGLFGPKGPTAAQIDSVVAHRPVILSDEGHHSVWVNTIAMEKAGITAQTPDPPQGQISHYEENGEPSGFLQEMAIDLITPVMPDLGVEAYKEAILHYQDIGLSNGITNAFEPMLSHTGDEPVRFAAYAQLEQEKKLKITFRVAPTLQPGADEDAFFHWIFELHQQFEGHDKMQVNTVKFFMDGVVDGHTALLREPYCEPPYDCGPVMFEQEELNHYVTRALREGYRIHTHAIGDAAVDEILNAYEVGQAATPEREHRNAITHLQVMTPEQPQRMRKLGVVAVANPYWHYKTPLYEPLEKPFLGEERAQHMYYLKEFLDAGVVVSQASDFPVTVPPDTMFCLHMMVNRKPPESTDAPYWPEQCIGVCDALRVLTVAGAYENDLEETKGTIAVGKDADFVYLDADVLTVPKELLYKTHVQQTWIQGSCVYTREQQGESVQ